jgi:serine/threonine protein kinase
MPKDLDALVVECLSKNPRDRPADAEASRIGWITCRWPTGGHSKRLAPGGRCMSRNFSIRREMGCL